jgi:hypothetical protein
MLHALSAMNHQRLKQYELARDELRQANELIETNYSAAKRNTTAWFDWEFASILRDEARALMEKDTANQKPVEVVR